MLDPISINSLKVIKFETAANNPTTRNPKVVFRSNKLII